VEDVPWIDRRVADLYSRGVIGEGKGSVSSMRRTMISWNSNILINLQLLQSFVDFHLSLLICLRVRGSRRRPVRISGHLVHPSFLFVRRQTLRAPTNSSGAGHARVLPGTPNLQVNQLCKVERLQHRSPRSQSSSRVVAAGVMQLCRASSHR
jgi:hypothetical protein